MVEYVKPLGLSPREKLFSLRISSTEVIVLGCCYGGVQWRGHGMVIVLSDPSALQGWVVAAGPGRLQLNQQE